MNKIRNSFIPFAGLLALIGVVAVFTSHAGYSREVVTEPSSPPTQEVVVTNTPLPITGQVGITGKPSVIVANPISIDQTNNTVTLASNSTLQVQEPNTVIAYDQTIVASTPGYDTAPIDVSAFKQVRVVLHYVSGNTSYSVQPLILGPGSISIPLESTNIYPGQGTVTRVYSPLSQNIIFAISVSPSGPVWLRIVVYGREN